MIGTAIAGGAALAGQVVGGILGSKAAREQRRALRAEQKKNQEWYERRYNEDATQRADVQRMLTRVEDSIRKRNKSAAGTAAVMGAPEESVALAKEANNEALANATADIVANAEARKDAIEQQYKERDSALQSALIGQKANQQAQMGQAVAQGLSTAGNIAGGMFDEDDVAEDLLNEK